MMKVQPLRKGEVSVRIGSVGLVSRFSKLYQSVDPSLVQVNICAESLRVDGKTQIIAIGRQCHHSRQRQRRDQTTQPPAPPTSVWLSSSMGRQLCGALSARAIQSVVTEAEREAVAFEMVGDVGVMLSHNRQHTIVPLSIAPLLLRSLTTASLAARRRRFSLLLEPHMSSRFCFGSLLMRAL
uniref:Uncharacterized protein n=1 Tax=Mycena chlorophos TaxID=658473 RepID=A0ABQ0KZA3_MYCCL|nr:predicted protein [Mycena chlorophos]